MVHASGHSLWRTISIQFEISRVKKYKISCTKWGIPEWNDVEGTLWAALLACQVKLPTDRIACHAPGHQQQIVRDTHM
jgi:hypothetical protein